MTALRGLLSGLVFGVACSGSDASPGGTCANRHCDGGPDAPRGAGGAAGGSGGATAGGSGNGGAGGVSAGGATHDLDASASGGAVTMDAGEASVERIPDAAVCPAGLGDCDHRADDGCETNILRHPNHCGACGHDCLGAECHDGLCDAIQLSTDSAGDLAVAGGSIFWVAGGIRTSSRDGGNLRDIARPEVGASSLSVAGNDVYWTDLGNAYFPSSFSNPGLLRVAPILDLDGGGVQTLYTGAVQQPLFELAGAMTTDETNVYWEVDDRSGTGSAFFKKPLGGGAAQRVFPDTGYLLKSDVQFMRAAKGHLFGAGGFAEAVQGRPVGGWLFRMGVDDGSYQKIWQSNDIAGITLDDFGDYIYMTGVAISGYDAGAPDASAPVPLRLLRVPMNGGAAEELWEGGGLGIAVDATGIYASTETSLQRFALAGGPPTVLVTGQTPRVIVTDDKAIYWSNFDAPGGIWKVAK